MKRLKILYEPLTLYIGCVYMDRFFIAFFLYHINIAKKYHKYINISVLQCGATSPQSQNTQFFNYEMASVKHWTKMQNRLTI